MFYIKYVVVLVSVGDPDMVGAEPLSRIRSDPDPVRSGSGQIRPF
jgi:hypothetical protein